LVPVADLMEANARFSTAQVASAQFIGPPLGSALFGATASLPFLADAVSFAGSAALVSAVPDEHAVDPPTTRLVDDVLDGLRFMHRNIGVRRMTEVLAVINFFYFAATSLLVLYVADELHSGTLVYTLTLVGTAAGTVLSRPFVRPLVVRFGTVQTLVWSFWLWAATMVGLAVTRSGVIAVALFVALGIGNGLWLVINTTLRQQLTPRHLLGRMNAAFRTVSWGVVPFGAAFGGVLAREFGLRAPFVAAAAAHVLVAVAGPRLLRPVVAAVAELDAAAAMT
jgi:MFS family permease